MSSVTIGVIWISLSKEMGSASTFTLVFSYFNFQAKLPADKGSSLVFAEA